MLLLQVRILIAPVGTVDRRTHDTGVRHFTGFATRPLSNHCGSFTLGTLAKYQFIQEFKHLSPLLEVGCIAQYYNSRASYRDVTG